MGKIILFLACAAGAIYWYVGSKRITEADVYKFYAQEDTWTEERNTKELCASFDKSYRVHLVSTSLAGREVVDLDKNGACENAEKFYGTLKALDASLGGQLLIDNEQQIESISISTDRKTASVAVKTLFKTGTAQLLIFQVSGKSTETFIKRDGRLYRTGVDGTALTR